MLGLRLRDMPAAGTALRLSNLQLLNLLPVTHSDKHVVNAQLEPTARISRVPRAILGDRGSDLHGGVTLFPESSWQKRLALDHAKSWANISLKTPTRSPVPRLGRSLALPGFRRTPGSRLLLKSAESRVDHRTPITAALRCTADHIHDPDRGSTTEGRTCCHLFVPERGRRDIRWKPEPLGEFSNFSVFFQ